MERLALNLKKKAKFKNRTAVKQMNIAGKKKLLVVSDLRVI